MANIDATGFTEAQRQALLDLLLLGMYADGHLASAEDATLHGLLRGMGVESKYDQDREMDAAVTRVRQHLERPEDAEAYVKSLAQGFSSPELRRQAAGVLEQFLDSDERLTTVEHQFLATVRAAFGI
jgi:hypothetical protein